MEYAGPGVVCETLTIQLMLDDIGLSRDAVLEELHSRKIGTGVHYIPVHEHPYYMDRFGYRPEDYPHASQVGHSTLSIPLSPGLSGDQQTRVIEALHQILLP